MTDEARVVIRYHERTKHHPHRYAASPGFLDWANEPNPFRRYEETPLLDLPLGEDDGEVDYRGLYDRRKNIFRPFSLENIAKFLELSMGLSAWKSYGGSSWALRMNPSSGNLHPTEAHLVLPPMPENSRGGVFHYSPFFHALEQRAVLGEGVWSGIRRHLGMDGFFVGLSSIYWRESWKYGERAFRYCMHDVGHAIACLSFSANLLGWKATYLNALSNGDLEIMLGFAGVKWKRFEEEKPDLLLFIHDFERDVPRDLPHEIIESFRSLSFVGEPNRLSKDHREWLAIEEVSSMTVKPKTAEMRYRFGDHLFLGHETPSMDAAKIIRQRRSAPGFDGKTHITKEDFFSMLDRTIPRSSSAPFDSELFETSVHLLLFVHRVSALDQGLYFLVREEKDLGEIKKRCHDHFLWKRVEDAPKHLSLYLLKKGDFRSEGAVAG
ncbi:MAG TPA: SagB/ThcOx family dehydrogenase [Thermodesulfovibrionales bacterium]|nr:SagB/ThcOx family dehydrogenase [Thermodesulfovibrionales bacterium]